MINDSISDFLIQLKNGNRAKRENVTLPASNLKLATDDVFLSASKPTTCSPDELAIFHLLCSFGTASTDRVRGNVESSFFR